MSENEVGKLYKEIQNILYKLIPEKWESLYLYASVLYDKGEMYFYYFPKKTFLKPKPINCYEIASKFGINEEQYNIVLNELYNKIKRLNCITARKWTNLTISIVNCLFTVEYNCSDLYNSNYTEEQRHIFWEYKYLHIPIEKLSKENQKILPKYIQEQNMQTFIYTEGIYIKSKKQKNVLENTSSELKNTNENEEQTKEIRNQILKC